MNNKNTQSNINGHSDPLKSSSLNTYQMTETNNSQENFSQVNGDDQHANERDNNEHSINNEHANNQVNAEREQIESETDDDDDDDDDEESSEQTETEDSTDEDNDDVIHNANSATVNSSQTTANSSQKQQHNNTHSADINAHTEQRKSLNENLLNNGNSIGEQNADNHTAIIERIVSVIAQVTENKNEIANKTETQKEFEKTATKPNQINNNNKTHENVRDDTASDGSISDAIIEIKLTECDSDNLILIKAANSLKNNSDKCCENQPNNPNGISNNNTNNNSNAEESNVFASLTMGQKNTKGSETGKFNQQKSSAASKHTAYRANSPLNGSSAGSSLSTSATSAIATPMMTTTTTPAHIPSPNINVPKITVEEYSIGNSNAGSFETIRSYESLVNDKEEFYDIENEQQLQQPAQDEEETNKEFYTIDKEPEQQANAQATSYGNVNNTNNNASQSASPTSMYSQMRYNYVKLEDVQEEEEDENEDADEDDEETDDDEDSGNENDQQQQHNEVAKGINESTISNARKPTNLDSEYQCRPEQQYATNRASHSLSRSPDRYYHKNNSGTSLSTATNNSENNLSSSYPDSGIGESSNASSSITLNSRFINSHNSHSAETEGTTTTTSTMHIPKHQQQQQQQHQHSMHHQQHPATYNKQRSPFVRDGNSTDCDETLMQCDDLLDFAESHDYLDHTSSERLVCIESISLPDVVVESTNSSSSSSASSIAAANNIRNQQQNNNYHAHVSDDVQQQQQQQQQQDRDIININGATGNSMGNIHFIPIHIEGATNSKKSLDDSVIGAGKATIEIIEDVTELQQNDFVAEKLKHELLEQKNLFKVKLEDAQNNVQNLQTKIADMQVKIEKLEQELSAKTWNVERLQGELNAAHKDDEYVRKKLKLLEDEKTNLRHRYDESEDELKEKYDQLEFQYKELEEKYQQTRKLASNLQTQLAQAQSDAEEWRNEVDKIRTELEEQIRMLKNSLENSENERKICEDKWQREFEMLRTHNMDREESIMTDCEWQLRQTQRQCKDKIDKVDNARKVAEEKVEILEEELELKRRECDDLKIFQAQVSSLRGVVSEQAQSITVLMEQIEHLKTDLETANTNLEQQIEAVKKIKYHCDNAIYDKERQMIYRIDEVRNEAAAFWEDKLYTELTRLKNELESVYVDERRDALDKLQAEHIEELKALTNRYSCNEEELRTELAETQAILNRKSEEFLELREKSDNALLQTRMHLDRADREYQNAMCREEERREELERKLNQQFANEKQEMEEKFRERLDHVKDEFNKELQLNTQELTETHRKQLEQIQSKLTAEKDEALQELAEKHRKKLANAEEKIKEIELRHQRDLKDLKAAYDAEKIALDKRDISNANEIEQLHRKCRCLTNLFEEMRMRYERRDPRAEDLREIGELRARCDSQEKDLYVLTDRLREMQIQMNELQQNGVNNAKKAKQVKKPPPKTIPTNCDVIYEENEERESSPTQQNHTYNSDDDDHDENEDDNNENDDDDDDDNNAGDNADTHGQDGEQQKNLKKNDKARTGDCVMSKQKVKQQQQKSCKVNNNKKLLNSHANEDESHMISAV